MINLVICSYTMPSSLLTLVIILYVLQCPEVPGRIVRTGFVLFCVCQKHCTPRIDWTWYRLCTKWHFSLGKWMYGPKCVLNSPECVWRWVGRGTSVQQVEADFLRELLDNFINWAGIQEELHPCQWTISP